MDVADLLKRLQQYGLDEGEAALYYHLCRLGPSRAAAVAEAAGRKRTDAYRILDHLVEKDFAQRTLERPARYIPHPVEEALERAMAGRRGETEALEAQRALLAQAWPRPLSQAGPARPRFTVHQGSTQVLGLLVRMIESAKEEVVLAISRDGLARLDVAALAVALQARAQAGVLVRILAKRARGGDMPLLQVEGVRVRYGDLPTFYQALVVDDREIGLFVAAGKGISGAEETVLWLNSSDVVLAQKALFDQAWTYALSPAELKGEAMPRQVQVLRGRWVRGARLREMVMGAKESIVIDASVAEVSRWQQQGIVDALARRAAQGVRVVLRLPPGHPAVTVPGAVAEPLVDPARGLLAIVDGVQTLLGLGLARPGEAGSAEDEWCVWSTHPDFVGVLGPADVRTAAGAAGAQPVRLARTHIA